MKVDEKLLKCSLTVGALFVVFSHPFLYRALHRQLSNVMAFVDMNMCPTEGGVFVHAVLFALTIYFGKQLYDKHYGPKKVKKIINNNPVSKEIKGKCKVYCENISNEIQQRNNNVEQNLPQQIDLNIPNQVPLNTISQVNNSNLANLQNSLGGGNNQMNNGNNMQNMMNNIGGNPNNMQNNGQNNMQNNGQNMGNVVNNLANNNMGNNNGLTGNMDYNNVSNVNIMGTQSTEINNLNNQGGLSCGSLPNFTNELSGSDTYSDNTAYGDDMFMRL